MTDHHAFWNRCRSRRVLQERDGPSTHPGIPPCRPAVNDVVARNHFEIRRPRQSPGRLARRQHGRRFRVRADCGKPREPFGARTGHRSAATGRKRRHGHHIRKQTGEERADEVESRRIQQQHARAGSHPRLETCRNRPGAAFQLCVRDRCTRPLAILEERVGAVRRLRSRPKAQELDERCAHERRATHAVSRRRVGPRMRRVSRPMRFWAFRKRLLIRHDEHRTDASR